MEKKPESFYKNSIKILWVIIFIITIQGCSYDHMGSIEKTLDQREAAWNNMDIDLYMSLVGRHYKYKPTSKMKLRQYLKENLLFWDQAHLQTYNRKIYIEKNMARVTQDYKMSVTKNGKTQVFSGSEKFSLKKYGFLSPDWKFIGGLDN